MIEVITGKPGSGKTYVAVHRMLELPIGKYVIYHNIEGLKPEKFPEPNFVKKIEGDIKEWCAKDNQIAWAEAVKEKYGRPMLVVIDEAQMIFGEKDHNLKGWLSWHRHLGQDIWLICQHYRMLHQDYYNLAEYEIRAVRSLLMNMFVYQYRVSGEAFKTMRKPKKQAVFGAYRSFNQTEASKPAFKLVYWVAALMVLAVGGFMFLQNSFWAKAEASIKPGGSVGAPGRVEKVSQERKGLPADPLESLSYVGCIGNKVMVQDVESGHLSDLGEAIQSKYGVLEASARWCLIITPKGKKRLTRKALQLEVGRAAAAGDAQPAKAHVRKSL